MSMRDFVVIVNVPILPCHSRRLGITSGFPLTSILLAPFKCSRTKNENVIANPASKKVYHVKMRFLKEKLSISQKDRMTPLPAPYCRSFSNRYANTMGLFLMEPGYRRKRNVNSSIKIPLSHTDNGY